MRPAGRMRPATGFDVAREDPQDLCKILEKFVTKFLFFEKFVKKYF